MTTDNPQIRIIDGAAQATNRCQDCKFFQQLDSRSNGNAALTTFEHCKYYGRAVLSTDRCAGWRAKR